MKQLIHRVLRQTPMSGMIPLPKVRMKRIVHKVGTVQTKIDDAISVISINNSLVQTMTSHQADKYQHGIQLIQNDFLLASKFMLLSRVLGSVFAPGDQKKVNVAIYICLLALVFFVSDF